MYSSYEIAQGSSGVYVCVLVCIFYINHYNNDDNDNDETTTNVE